jgi:protein-S-isoprenylcysteine O-methyltransferase Ste14
MNDADNLKRLLKNAPVPEIHLLLLVLGGGLHRVRPRRLLASSRQVRRTGVAFIIAGLLGAAWATWTTREVDVSRPNHLVQNGPYAYSRNPMYLAWTLLQSGIALAVNSFWLAASVPLVALLTDRLVIVPEEARLEDAFGEEYLAYQTRVRRWL